ncbi:rRNA processing protein [Enterococcus hirae]
MTNYNGEKGKRLRGSMAPKTDDEVALAGTNSGETENKQESLSGTNSGETENKQESLSGTNSGEVKDVALSGSNSVEEEEPKKPNAFEKEVEKLAEEVKEKFEELTSKKDTKK